MHTWVEKLLRKPDAVALVLVSDRLRHLVGNKLLATGCVSFQVAIYRREYVNAAVGISKCCAAIVVRCYRNRGAPRGLEGEARKLAVALR